MPGQGSSRSSLQDSYSRKQAQGETSMRRGTDMIRGITTRLHLPEVIRSGATRMFGTVIADGAGRGQKTETLCAACVFLACRQANAPRSFKEITAGCADSDITKEMIGRCSRLVISALKMEALPVTKATELIPRFADQLDLSHRVMCAAQYAATAACEKFDIGATRAQASIASAAIYLICVATDSALTLEGLCNVLRPRAGAVKKGNMYANPIL